MTEVYVLTEVNKSTTEKILTYLMLALAILTFVANFVFPVLLVPCVLIAIVWAVMQFYSFKEYECSYFDGEVRFARIRNKSRRKRLMVFDMDKVIQIAPAGDRSLHRFVEDSSVKKIDYTSKTGAPYYQMAVNEEGRSMLISFEPDDKYLDAVCVKYNQKVIRNR